MKPITLTLCGWGPFRDSQTVDFTKLSENGFSHYRTDRSGKNNGF